METQTKQCPFCGKEIKAVAKKCRYCGEWFEENLKPQSEQHSNTISEDSAHDAETPNNTVESEDGVGELHQSKVGCIIIASIVLIGIICLFVIISKSSHNSDDYYTSDTIADEMSYEYNNEASCDKGETYSDESDTDDEISYGTTDSFDSNSDETTLGTDIFELHKRKIKGTYLADVSSMLGDIDMARQYGKYVITEETISSYSWDDQKKTWVKNYTTPYKLIYNASDDYMNGYNLVYNAYGSEMKMCTGDVNNDGKMDIWCSNSMFHTKQ